MRNFYKCLLSLCLVAGGIPAARAQLVMNRQVIAASGGVGIVGNLSFQYTIGDFAVTTLTKNPRMLTQGFQQPEELPPATPGATTVLNMMVYPNPAVTNAKIQFDMLYDNVVALLIINSSGQVVYKEYKTYAAGRIIINLPVNHFGAGIYTVRLQAGGNLYQDKLIIL